MVSGRRRVQAMFRVITSTSAASRLNAARAALQQLPSSAELLVIGATRGAADDFVRAMAHEAGATFGLNRFSLTELAARCAAALTSERRAPATHAAPRRWRRAPRSTHRPPAS